MMPPPVFAKGSIGRSAALTFQTNEKSERPTIGTERKDYVRDACEGERKSAQIQLKPQYPCRQMQPTIE